MKKTIVFLILLLLCCNVVIAIVIGGSNLGIMGYPKPSAYKPHEPFSYDGTISKFEFDNYRNSVLRYIDELEEYIDNGNNDINRIREAQEEAVDMANRAIKDFNSWANTIKVKSNF